MHVAILTIHMFYCRQFPPPNSPLQRAIFSICPPLVTSLYSCPIKYHQNIVWVLIGYKIALKKHLQRGWQLLRQICYCKNIRNKTSPQGVCKKKVLYIGLNFQVKASRPLPLYSVSNSHASGRKFPHLAVCFQIFELSPIFSMKSMCLGQHTVPR